MNIQSWLRHPVSPLWSLPSNYPHFHFSTQALGLALLGFWFNHSSAFLVSILWVPSLSCGSFLNDAFSVVPGKNQDGRRGSSHLALPSCVPWHRSPRDESAPGGNSLYCRMPSHLCIIWFLYGHFSLVTHSILDFSQSAVGHEYVAEVEKHSSQTDSARGFGGKYGVEKDRADKVSDNSLSHITQLRSRGTYRHTPWRWVCASPVKDRAVDSRRARHQDRSCDLPQQLPWRHCWRPHAELKGIDLNETKTLKLCLNKESPRTLIFIISVHMREKRDIPKLPKHWNFINTCAFQENRDVSFSVITTAANNQVKQLIRVTVFLEGNGYFSHYLAPNSWCPGV